MRRKSHVQAMTVNSSAHNDTAAKHSDIHVICVGNAFSLGVIITGLCTLKQRTPPPRRPTSNKSDPHPDFGRNPDFDPHVCRIAPKMLRIRYLGGTSHFAECRQNRLQVKCYANKSPKTPDGEGRGNVIWNPYLGPDHHQKSISSSFD